MTKAPPRGTRVGEEDALGRRWSGSRWVTYDTLIKKLKLSPEVAAYLDARDMEWPSHGPLIKTPEPRTVPDAAFSFARVDRVIESLKRLRHTQGKLAGQPLMPDPWQVAYFIAPVFGWVKPGGGPDGFVRIIRNATLDVPRKNGKSTISGGLALYLTAADGEMGAQVVAAASTKDQAGFTFEPVKQLAERAPALKGHVKPFKTRITHPKSGSYFQVIASSADAQHGANLHGGIIDEIHIHKNGALIEAIETGTGSREQPLIIKITTADEGKPNTPYAVNRDYLEKLARGVFKDPARYGAIFAADDKADPFVEETWAAANPGYPVSPTRAFMEDKANEARHNPIALASFKRLHLGIRTRQRTQFISTSEWRLNSGGPLDERNLEGRVAYGGLDLASVSDLTALCWLFPREDAEPGYEALWRFWVPEEAVEALDERTSGAASRVWVPRGWLSTTPGNVTDYDWVKKQILEDAEKFDVQSIGLDRWNSTQLSNDLMEEDVPILKVGQGMASMSPALKEVQRLVKMGAAGRPADRVPRLRHGGNPVMTWNVDNLAVDVDPAGNVKPSKSNSADKIDGVAALCDAMFAALHAPPAPASAYEEHGVRAV